MRFHPRCQPSSSRFSNSFYNNTIGTGAIAFAIAPNSQVHVFYLAGNYVSQLFLPTPATQWSNTDLTALTAAASLTTPAKCPGETISRVGRGVLVATYARDRFVGMYVDSLGNIYDYKETISQ